MGGRIAFVVAPDYDPNMTAVRLFNGFRCPTGTEPSTSGCMPPPPKPRCTYHANQQLYDPGSKHTLAPVAAADEAACCVKCMESTACYGAELYDPLHNRSFTHLFLLAAFQIYRSTAAICICPFA